MIEKALSVNGQMPSLTVSTNLPDIIKYFNSIGKNLSTRSKIEYFRQVGRWSKYVFDSAFLAQGKGGTISQARGLPQKWYPLSASTKLHRARTGEGYAILDVTGYLKKAHRIHDISGSSITYGYGTEIHPAYGISVGVIAARHQEGFSFISHGSVISVPPRPIYDPTTRDLQALARYTSDYLYFNRKRVFRMGRR